MPKVLTFLFSFLSRSLLHPKGFYINVYGHARAHWTEQRSRTTGSGNNRRTTHYTVYFEGKDVYLNSTTYLFGRSGGEAQKISAGTHLYHFATQLPSLLPSTFFGKHGDISYYVEAILDVPWFFDEKFKLSFNVVRIEDLNLYPELRMGQKLEEIKTFCCMCFASEPLLISATIPRSGFALGEIIPIRIEYNNQSDVDVLKTIIKLKRTISFISYQPHSKTKSDDEAVVEVSARGANRCSKTEIDAALTVPAILQPSNGKYCNVIRIEYYLKLEVDTDGWHA
jgi:hypothetical protein